VPGSSNGSTIFARFCFLFCFDVFFFLHHFTFLSEQPICCEKLDLFSSATNIPVLTLLLCVIDEPRQPG
jgi:hypothetical protein